MKGNFGNFVKQLIHGKNKDSKVQQKAKRKDSTQEKRHLVEKESKDEILKNFADLISQKKSVDQVDLQDEYENQKEENEKSTRLGLGGEKLLTQFGNSSQLMDLRGKIIKEKKLHAIKRKEAEQTESKENQKLQKIKDPKLFMSEMKRKKKEKKKNKVASKIESDETKSKKIDSSIDMNSDMKVFPKRKRKKTRSKQKNIKKDHRPKEIIEKMLAAKKEQITQN